MSSILNFLIFKKGYDDIHYFAQINSYVMVPYQDRYIVAEVVGVREKDTPDFTNTKEQELNKIYSIKHLDVLPIGTIKDMKFSFGVSVYPTLYSGVLYIKDEELNILFEVQDAEVAKCPDCEKDGHECKVHKDALKGKTRTKSFDVGESAIFPDYKIKIDVDRFFGSHAAVLGNTGIEAELDSARTSENISGKRQNEPLSARSSLGLRTVDEIITYFKTTTELHYIPNLKDGIYKLTRPTSEQLAKAI